MRAGVETKSDFSRKLGLKDPDHYIGAENDTPGKRPSLDIIEGAARLAGFEFTDCIHLPGADLSAKINRARDKLHRQLDEILEAGGNPALWISGNISTFHDAHIKRRRRTP